jgi:hypothetical protein
VSAVGFGADDKVSKAGDVMTGTLAFQGTPPFTLVNGLYMGTVTLNGTTAVVVSTAAVDASNIVMLTVQSGVPVGLPYVSAKVNGASFSVKSTSASDTAVVCGWVIVEHA